MQERMDALERRLTQLEKLTGEHTASLTVGMVMAFVALAFELHDNKLLSRQKLAERLKKIATQAGLELPDTEIEMVRRIAGILDSAVETEAA